MTTLTAPPRTFSPTIVPDQIAKFHTQGFLTLDAITTPQDVAHIQELLEGLFNRFHELPKELALDLGDVKNHNGTQVIQQINAAITFEPRLKETLYYKNAEKVARALLGREVRCNWDHAIYKPPHNGKETPWHQDMAYGARAAGFDREKAIGLGCNFWMPLQDVTVDSGCMQFIPHSNLISLLPHQPVGNDPAVHTLETLGTDTKKAVACPIPKGGCTIHAPKTLHYTGPNNTQNWRRVWILFFGVDMPRTL
jgi:ectoine hydroxylase-related dioxygenase (phytanoyl-CoA dioxygenase family)